MSSTNQGDKPNDNRLYAQDLVVYVNEILGDQVQSLVIEVFDEGLILRGTCCSFYSKQVAQEIVKKSSSRRILSNLIVVRDPPIR